MSEGSIHQTRYSRQVEGAGQRAESRDVPCQLSGNRDLIGREPDCEPQEIFILFVLCDHKRKRNKKSIVSERDLDRDEEAKTPSKTHARRNGQKERGSERGSRTGRSWKEC